MVTREDYSEHHRPYVDDRGFLSPRFYDPEVTHEQFFRYESMPPWSDSEARIRFREFGFLKYAPVYEIIPEEYSIEGQPFPLREVLRREPESQLMMRLGALVGPRAIDMPERRQTLLLPGVMFFALLDNPNFEFGEPPETQGRSKELVWEIHQ